MNERRGFNNRPFVVAAAGLSGGILAGKFVLGTAAYVLCAIALLLALAARLLRAPHLPLLLLLFGLGLLRLTLSYPVLPRPAENCVLSGRIAQTPIRQENGWRLQLSGAAANGKPIDGGVLVTLPDPKGAYAPEYGQTLRAAAALTLPEGARNDGGLDYRFYCFSQGIVCLAYIEKGTVSLADGPSDLYGLLLRLRTMSTQALIRMMGRTNGALAAGMLNGDVTELPDTVLYDFRGSGIAHLLSVSGLHVTLAAGAVLFLLKRVKPVPQFLAVCGFLLLYCAFCAFAPPTLRSALMTACLLLSRLVGRRNDPLSSLAFSALLILLLSPFALFNAGFQLSYTAVLGILLLYPRLNEAWARLPGMLREPLALSIGAGAGILPASAANFNSVSLLSVPANLLVIPLCAFVMLPSAAALLLYPLLPGVAAFVASLAGAALSLMRAVAYAAASPGMLNIPSPSLAAGALFFLGMLFYSHYYLGEPRAKRLLTATSAALCLMLWIAPALLLPRSSVTVLDVPSGYAAHIRSPSGDTLLGTAEALGGSAVQGYLAANGVHGETRRVTDAKGAAAPLGETSISVYPGGAAAEGRRYETDRNGQLRFFYRNGALQIRAYAPFDRYAILVESP